MARKGFYHYDYAPSNAVREALEAKGKREQDITTIFKKAMGKPLSAFLNEIIIEIINQKGE